MSSAGDFVFRERDCAVAGSTFVGSDGVARTPRWGAQAGNPTDEGDLAGVVVRHVPTGLVTSEDRFHPARNKELAMLRLKAMVEDWIKQAQEHVAGQG